MPQRARRRAVPRRRYAFGQHLRHLDAALEPRRRGAAGGRHAACSIAGLFAVERAARGGARSHHTTGRYRAIPFQEIAGWKGVVAAGLASLPFFFGFVVPLLVIAQDAATHTEGALSSGFLPAAGNTLVLAIIAAAVAVAVALTLGYARRVARTRFIRSAGRVAALGYAVPGTVLAIGLLIPLAGIDNYVDGFMRSTFGVSTGLLLSGSLFAITAGLYDPLPCRGAGSNREPGSTACRQTSMPLRARLAKARCPSLWRVHLPLLMAPLGAAALLVFVDCMKELPATLLLRPFNFETLATHVYSLASIEQLEQASLGALTIVLAGLVPVLLLHEAIAGGRPGASQR